VYTLYSRTAARGVRVAYHGRGLPPGLREDKPALISFLQDCPDDAILSVTETYSEPPGTARIRNSVPCRICGESVMDTRLRDLDGQAACIPCDEAAGRNSKEST